MPRAVHSRPEHAFGKGVLSSPFSFHWRLLKADRMDAVRASSDCPALGAQVGETHWLLLGCMPLDQYGIPSGMFSLWND